MPKYLLKIIRSSCCLYQLFEKFGRIVVPTKVTSSSWEITGMVKNNAKSAGKRMPWRRKKKHERKISDAARAHLRQTRQFRRIARRLSYVWRHKFSVCLSYRFAQDCSTTCGSRMERRQDDRLNEGVVPDGRSTQGSVRRARYAREWSRRPSNNDQKKGGPTQLFSVYQEGR